MQLSSPHEQAEGCVSIEFNPIRCGFHGVDAPNLITRDILNTGVKPALLLECVRENFERMGGVVMERASLNGITVHPDGAWLNVSPAGGPGGGIERLYHLNHHPRETNLTHTHMKRGKYGVASAVPRPNTIFRRLHLTTHSTQYQ